MDDQPKNLKPFATEYADGLYYVMQCWDRNHAAERAKVVCQERGTTCLAIREVK